MNSEKMPAGSGAHGLIQYRPESEHLRFHCWPRNRGKGREIVKVYTITYLLKKLSATKMNFEKLPAGGGSPG